MHGFADLPFGDTDQSIVFEAKQVLLVGRHVVRPLQPRGDQLRLLYPSCHCCGDAGGHLVDDGKQLLNGRSIRSDQTRCPWVVSHSDTLSRTRLPSLRTEPETT